MTQLTEKLLTIQSLFMRNERVSAYSIGAVMLVSAIVMGLISLTVLNDKASKGYLLQKLEAERQDLVTDGEITERLNLQARSISGVKEKVEAKGMQQVSGDEIVYLMGMSALAQNP